MTVLELADSRVPILEVRITEDGTNCRELFVLPRFDRLVTQPGDVFEGELRRKPPAGQEGEQ